MSTRLGLHVASGSRNGYGVVVEAAPAVVLAVGEGGALVEAKEKSGGRTVTIFRTTEVYDDAPPNIDHVSEAEARAMADQYWPALKEKLLQNPGAEYLQPTNEYGGDNPTSLRNLVAFETRLMELAERDGFKLAVGSPAGGSPGSWDLWTRFFVPLIRRAGQGGHIYSRHAYGGVVEGSSGYLTNPDGTPADANAGRPFREAEYLRSQGILTPIVITEAGQNGGYRFPGVEPFIADVMRYDALCRQHANIWGFCAWTYGSYQSFPANIQDASGALAAYLIDEGGAVRPAYPSVEEEPVTLEEQIWQHSIEEQTERGFHRAPTALQAAVAELEPQGYRYVTRETYPDGLPPYIAVEDFSGEEKPRRVLYWIGGQVKTITDPAQPQPFRFEAWPTTERRVTQRFGANPDYYRQFGLPGHEGVDIAAAHNTPVYVVADGTVDFIRAASSGHPYGNAVYVRHADGYRTAYAHNASLLVKVGDKVTAGQQIARADNTGNSQGSHLHLTLYRDGHSAPGYPNNIIDPTPFLAPFNPAWPGAGTPQPTPGTIDLLPYFLPVPGGNGPLFELRWPDGKQERTQVQSDGAWFYVTKGSGGIGGASEWEQLRADATYIWRGLDTSPGEGRYYWQRETGNDAARWCKRHMFVGETFVGAGHHVQFYDKATCQPVDAPWNGPATNRVTFLARHAAWQSPSGLVLNDVVEIGDPAGEVFILARGIGMVGWRSPWGTSGISELHAPGARPDNVRERLCS
jgi:murein DD-endopeptidase MepM/ murein hydrolase activator NlpD